MIVVASMVCLAAPQSARADRWYGWQTLSTDAFAYTATMAGAKWESREGGSPGDGWLHLGIGVVTYVVAPPVIHLAHGEYARAGWSLGRRIGLPLAGGAIGYVMMLPFDCDSCETAGGVLGFVGGTVANTVIDAVIARASEDSPDAVMFAIGGGF